MYTVILYRDNQPVRNIEFTNLEEAYTFIAGAKKHYSLVLKNVFGVIVRIG